MKNFNKVLAIIATVLLGVIAFSVFWYVFIDYRIVNTWDIERALRDIEQELFYFRTLK